MFTMLTAPSLGLFSSYSLIILLDTMKELKIETFSLKKREDLTGMFFLSNNLSNLTDF